jgi:hypothetical protein
VAFARPGKSRGSRFYRQNADAPKPPAPAFFGSSQRFLKPRRAREEPGFFRRKQEMAAVSRKREARKSVHQSGWITLDGGFAARRCMVHDLSSSGAKITVEDASVLAGNLRLAFSRDAKTGRRCEVVWRRGKSLGVKFVR